jgi:hypothetical protein
LTPARGGGLSDVKLTGCPNMLGGLGRPHRLVDSSGAMSTCGGALQYIDTTADYGGIYARNLRELWVHEWLSRLYPISRQQQQSKQS